ncbi:MAG: LuxR C-terminal-related transcriptional regulator [Oscillospiraceae bacterium]|nr:LuxR C-terminal-related transcriptional regulator [Oscillospiraceae bacterium]
MSNSFISNMGTLTQSSAFYKRNRISKLLENAVEFPLVAVYAGSGYGKTRTVYSFLQEYNGNTTWMQLTERDNDTSRFWEKYTHLLSLTWFDIASRLADIGFPDTREAFIKYIELRDEAFASDKKNILVFDDFHILENPEILRFFEWTVNYPSQNFTIILLSRTTPEINMVSMMMQERVFIIREEILCFTEDEIAEYFDNLLLPYTRQDIRDIYDDTRGWAFAINLIGRSLSKDMKYERYALTAMKENVFKLIESEISRIRDTPLWNLLLRISLIGHLSSNLISLLVDDNSLIKELDSLNAYVRYEHHLGVYRIHDIFLDYLRTHQYMLSEDEKCDTFNKAGIWCENNNYFADALAYYEKAGKYSSIIRLICSFDLHIGQETARYALDLLNRLPKDVSHGNPLYPVISLRIRISLGLFDEAFAAAVEYATELESLPDSIEKNSAQMQLYRDWAILRLYMAVSTNKYDFDVYFQKMREYFDKDQYIPETSPTPAQMGVYALLFGANTKGAPEEYIDSLRRAIPHFSYVHKGIMYGLDDLAQGELLYVQRDLINSEQYLYMALDKARQKSQYDIQSRALLYLMLIAFSQGRLDNAENILMQAEELLDIADFKTRFETYDIIRSHYYLALDQPEKIPYWLKSDFERYAHPAFLDNYANRVRMQYRYCTKQYSTLLAYLETIRESDMPLLGKIAFHALEALCLYKLKQRDEAITALTKAYHLAEPNGIVTPFTHYAKDMRTLTGAALRVSSCTIPRAWLQDINRKSSAFARRQTHMIMESKANGDDDEKVSLTERETKVLKDLTQGLSRTEIAASQNISINTVKMVINSIYDKLYVNNLHDALRIAIVQNII